jgi:hypothetical protein
LVVLRGRSAICRPARTQRMGAVLAVGATR